MDWMGEIDDVENFHIKALWLKKKENTRLANKL